MFVIVEVKRPRWWNCDTTKYLYNFPNKTLYNRPKEAVCSDKAPGKAPDGRRWGTRGTFCVTAFHSQQDLPKRGRSWINSNRVSSSSKSRSSSNYNESSWWRWIICLPLYPNRGMGEDDEVEGRPSSKKTTAPIRAGKTVDIPRLNLSLFW